MVPATDAKVSVNSIEFAYGFGVYETLRIKNKKALFAEDHLSRLQKSAEILRLEHDFMSEMIVEFIEDFIANTGDETYNLKMLLIGAAKREDAQLYIFGSNPFFPKDEWYTEGVKVTTAHFERAFPHAKSLNMLQSYLAYRDAKGTGAYDALLINNAGNITEGTRTNFFALKGRTIISPPESEILLGVTRTHVIEIAKQNGFDVIEKDIPLISLREYDGAFITSTSTRILPLKEIGDHSFSGIVSDISELIAAFDTFHREQ